MKLEKLEERLDALVRDPGDEETLQRILRMIGDELPRYRRNILDKTRVCLAVAISALREDMRAWPSAFLAAMALESACVIIVSYQVAAAERHCALCDDALVRHYILRVSRSDVPQGRFCHDCIVDAVRKIRPDAVRAFVANRSLDEEPALYADSGEPGKPGIEIRLATYSRRS